MQPVNQRHSPVEKGFTMLELIIVIVLIGILGASGAEFIAMAFKSFHDTDRRTEIYEEGRLAMMRMERELRSAAPNAVTVSTTDIAFGMIDGREMAPVFGRYNEETPTNAITDPLAAPSAGSLISINNSQWADFNGGGRLYQITSVVDKEMTLSKNVVSGSPEQRYFVICGPAVPCKQAVRYRVDNNAVLWRETATISATGVGAFGNPYPLARNLSKVDTLDYFTYTTGTDSNILVEINFAIISDNETVKFHQEIQIRNVP
jgi:MSHA biogenesis protein MshO